MRTIRFIAEELRALHRAWDDQAGRRYVTHFLGPLDLEAEELRRALAQFEKALPLPPKRA